GVFYVQRNLIRRLTSIGDTMRRLSAGETEITVASVGDRGGIGDMAGAVVVFQDGARGRIRLGGHTGEQRRPAGAERRRNEELQRPAAAEQAQVAARLADGLKRLSAGDLTCRLDDGFSESYRQIKDDFNVAVAGLQETINAIAGAAREVANAAAEISTS